MNLNDELAAYSEIKNGPINKVDSIDESTSKIRRRSVLTGSFDSIKYIASLPRDDFRKSDRVSDILVLACLSLAVLMIANSSIMVAPATVIIVGSFFLAVLIFFVMSRVGIITTLAPRQAVLVWELMLGMLLMGVLLCFYGMYIIAYLNR